MKMYKRGILNKISYIIKCLLQLVTSFGNKYCTYCEAKAKSMVVMKSRVVIYGNC